MICITFNKLKTTGECRYHNNMASIARPRNKDAWNLKLKCHQILCSAMHRQESTCMIKGDELDSLLLFRCQLVEGRKAIWVFNSNFFLIISNNSVSSILRKKKTKKKTWGCHCTSMTLATVKKPGLLFIYGIQGGHGTSRLD